MHRYLLWCFFLVASSFHISMAEPHAPRYQSDLEVMCNHIRIVVLDERDRIEQRIEHQRQQPTAQDREAVATNLNGSLRGYLPYGRNPSPTTEPNAFWDGDIFGWGYQDRRTSTNYWIRGVDPLGRYITEAHDYELSRDHFTEASPWGLPLAYGNRVIEGESSGWRIYRLPDSRLITISGLRRIVMTEVARERNRPMLFLRRNYNTEESSLLSRINTLSANYRSYLRRRYDALQRQRQATSNEEERNTIRAQLHIMHAQHQELQSIHNIDVPPNAGPDLVYSGPEAPPVPTAAQFHPATIENIGRQNHIGIWRNQRDEYVLVEFQVRGEGAEQRYQVRSLEGYTNATVERRVPSGPSDPVIITPRLPPEREPTGESFVLTPEQMRESLNRFWVLRQN